MLIGIPKEIKPQENRVALLPAGVVEMKKRGHRVLVETGAGLGSGFPDKLYINAGAEVAATAGEVWQRAEMIMKVKEPIAPEYPHMREEQVVFTFFHFAADEALTHAVMDSGIVAVAYETVERADHSLPLLIPMSEVAGRMSVQVGARFLEKPQEGRGILLAGIPGVRPANVLVLGGGIVGVNAAKIAAGMGANVTIMDIDVVRLRQLDDFMPRNVTTLTSSEHRIREILPSCDLVIGAVLVHGAKAPHLITRDMLRLMQLGSVIVDVAIDQGGCIETAHPTTHDDPVFTVDEIVHYCVANMPGAVPFTSTLGLTNVTLPYALQIADKGWQQAASENPELAQGMNIINGEIVYKDVADAFGLKWKPLDEVIGRKL